MSGRADAVGPGSALATVLTMGAETADPGDARRLLAAAAGVAPGKLALLGAEDFTDALVARYLGLAKRRAAGEPVSHLVGYRDFYKARFSVTPEVLDPRPETEILVALALKHRFAEVLDLGTGSGCILLSLLAERPRAKGVGVDLSPGALEVAEENAKALGVADRAVLGVSNWYSAIGGRFDLIVSNPPYIAAGEMAGLAPELRFEPRRALTDEGDGLSAYRAIAAGAAEHLNPAGLLLVEIGPTQAEAVSAIFRAVGLEVTGVYPDLDGRNRVISAAGGDFA